MINLFSFFEIGQGKELSEEEYNDIRKVTAFMSISGAFLLIMSLF